MSVPAIKAVLRLRGPRPHEKLILLALADQQRAGEPDVGLAYRDTVTKAGDPVPGLLTATGFGRSRVTVILGALADPDRPGGPLLERTQHGQQNVTCARYRLLFLYEDAQPASQVPLPTSSGAAMQAPSPSTFPNRPDRGDPQKDNLAAALRDAAPPGVRVDAGHLKLAREAAARGWSPSALAEYAFRMWPVDSLRPGGLIATRLREAADEPPPEQKPSTPPGPRCPHGLPDKWASDGSHVKCEECTALADRGDPDTLARCSA